MLMQTHGFMSKSPTRDLQWLKKSAGNSIGRRMAIYILMFSSVVTLLATALQLGLEYRRDVHDIEVQLEQIRDSYSESLAGSLWNTSQKDLQLQLNGILRLPDVRYVEVLSEQDQLIVKVGQTETAHTISRAFPLYYTHREQQVLIGKVRTVVSLDGVYQRLKDKVVVILISQTIKTFLVSLFILFLFHLLVGRHLKKIATYSELSFEQQMASVMTLERKSRDGDELDQVVIAMNDMHQRLQQAFNSLREANEHMEEQVRLRTAQLQSANKELEAFSYSVSHDLRSPLRGIDGWSLALQEDYGAQLDATGQQYLDRVRAETQRMGQLIDDMLQFSRLGRAEIVMRTVDLSQIAHTVAQRIRDSYPQRQFDFQIQAGLSARGDPKLLEIVLTNLLENASKFTGMREVARIAFGQKNMLEPESLQPRAVFFISDNGVGFDMAYAQKLFGVFQRLHKASDFPGTGIGLATVHRIVHRHGGSIWAEAQPGQGAHFYFTLELS